MDSSIIGDSQAFGGRFQRDIEVAADKDLFPLSLEVLDGEVGHGESACDVAEKVDTAVAVAPLVVIPTNEFKESFIQAHTRGGVENTRGRAVNEVGGNNFIGGVEEDALEISLRSFLHGLADFLVGSVFGGANGEIDNADGGRRNTEGHTRELSLDFGAHEADRFGGTGGGRDNVNGGRSSAFPILTGWTIDRFLGCGVAVDGGHESFFHTESLFEKNMNKRGEAVGGAGSVGDDVMFRVVVLEVIDAHDNGDVLAFRRGGDDDLGAACSEMALSFICFSEEAG